MRVRQFRDIHEAALYVATRVEAVVLDKAHPVLGLATGETPIPLYQELVAFHRQGLSFRHVTTVNLDEYVGLSPDHPQSYYRFMADHFWNRVDIPADKTHIPHGLAPDLEQECRRYDQVLAAHPIDLQVLGIGRNGHIGFNEPGVLNATTHVVALTADTLAANARFFDKADTVPTHAITMGMETILQSREIVLMAFGRDKADAVGRALGDTISSRVPASFLQRHPNVTFVLDHDAALALRHLTTVPTSNNVRAGRVRSCGWDSFS